MANLALGLIETIGLTAGIEAADAAVKSANVKLIGYELTKGDGMTTVKIEGDVGAVKAAVEAAKAAASKVGGVYSTLVIPRPAQGIDNLTRSADTVGLEQPEAAAPEEPPAEEKEPEQEEPEPPSNSPEMTPPPEPEPEPPAVTETVPPVEDLPVSEEPGQQESTPDTDQPPSGDQAGSRRRRRQNKSDS